MITTEDVHVSVSWPFQCSIYVMCEVYLLVENIIDNNCKQMHLGPSFNMHVNVSFYTTHSIEFQWIQLRDNNQYHLRYKDYVVHVVTAIPKSPYSQIMAIIEQYNHMMYASTLLLFNINLFFRKLLSPLIFKAPIIGRTYVERLRTTICSSGGLAEREERRASLIRRFLSSLLITVQSLQFA
ncbi:hypothetical protein BDA99DRAFT_536915 [Phascolomyces articulosus]|uniref:Uncharacterized protein n=1 Tax=Phascolomyces articulosus TaxID=60185 RepID=A0AAD5PEK5_9FUNG|nr:hypothetical protein BDA99DRAFT_536915 [Phascolomyces articulosus]